MYEEDRVSGPFLSKIVSQACMSMIMYEEARMSKIVSQARICLRPV